MFKIKRLFIFCVILTHLLCSAGGKTGNPLDTRNCKAGKGIDGKEYECYSDNVIKKITAYEEDGSTLKRVDEYYETKNLRKKKITDYLNGRIKTISEYRDDENNYKTRFIEHEFDEMTGLNPKFNEETFYLENGKRDKKVKFKPDGTTSECTLIFTYWENKNQKTEIKYDENNMKNEGYPKCKNKDGDNETCTKAKHGCAPTDDNCGGPSPSNQSTFLRKCDKTFSITLLFLFG